VILNRLSDKELGTADRILGWLLILLGYVMAMGLAADPGGWEDPVFNVVRKLPYTPYSWSIGIALFTIVYTIGERAPQHWRGRGRVIIVGALLCGLWWACLSFMMARMVYEQPTRITILWPFMTIFVAFLYASRVVVYANTFTGDRWRTNPYQLWDTLMLITVSLSQVIIGAAPGSIFTEVEKPVMFQLALVNLMGASIVMFGLHMRNKDLGLNLELAGAMSLVATLAWYCASVTSKQTLAGTTLGFGLAEAFVFATLHRSIQIITLKWARRYDKDDLAHDMKQALNPPRRRAPLKPVEDDDTEIADPANEII
jgi:hypothetical protein